MTRADELYEQYKSQKEGKSQRYYKTRADELYDKFSTSKTFKNRIEYVDSKEKQGVRVYDIATSSYKIERPVDEDYIKNYINDFNDYAESSQNDYGNVTYNNANSYNAQYSQTSNELKGRAEKIARYLKANRKQIDPKSYSELLPYIEQSVDVLDTTSKAFGDANKYYSQWDTEKDYNSYLKGIEERESLLIYDTDSAREKINSLDSQIASLDSSIKKLQGDYEYKYGKSNSEGSTNINTNDPASIVDSLLGNSGAPSGFDPYSNTPNNGNPYGNGAPATMNSVGIVAGSPKEADAMLKQISEQQKKRAQLESERNSINVTYNLATHVQTADQLYNDALNDENFNLYSDKGANNKLATQKAAYESGYVFGEATTLSLEQRFAKYATDEEMDIYSYYIGKGDEASAQAFLTSMEETINARKGLEIYEAVEDNIALEMAFGVAAGLNQFTTGVGNLFNDKDYYTPTATAMASASVREDLAEVGDKLPDWIGGSSSDENQRTSYAQVGYDFITTTANMLPSILTSAAVTYLSKGALGAEAAAFLGQSVGSFTLGASAAGNAYAEMINLGYDKDQAKMYATLVGGSEAGLQYIMGGVGKLGGIAKSGKKLMSFVDNIDNAFAKTAIKFGSKVIPWLSEGAEEYTQEILDPFFKNLAFNESNEIKLYTPEALYSGVLGAFSAGLLDGVPSSVNAGVNATRTYQTGKTLTKNNNFDVKNLVELGNKMSADSVAYKIANKVNDKTGAYTIGKLFHSIGAELSVQNQQDIVKSLTLKGVAPENAETIADWLGATVNGAKLTKQQINALELNEDIANTFRDVIINPNSTINQRRQAWFEAGGFDVASNADADMNAYSPDAVMDRINESQMLTTQSAPSLEIQLAQLAQEKASKSTEAPTAEQSNPFIPLAKQTAPVQNTEKIKALDSVVAKEHDVSDIEGKTIIKNTNEAVNIKKITSIDKNSMTLELDDGREVSSRDISYASEGEALVYETVADITNSAESANAIINAFDVAKPKNANAWAAGARMVYTDGKNSIPFSEIAKQDFTSYLSNEAKKLIYNLGQQDAITETAKAEKAKKTTNKKAKGKGRVTFEGKENFSTDGFTDVQRASVAYANVISKITGVEIRLFRSEKVNGRFVYTDENGEVKVAPNGKYIPGKNIIMLDINAGINGEGTMLYTLAHELTHYIKEWSPAKFKSLANFLMEQYGKQGRSVDELVQAQIRKAKSNGRTIDYDIAYEEVIADSMEAMLADGKVIEKLQQLYKQDKSLYRKIVDFVNKWVDKVKQLYTEYSPDSKEGKLVLEMKDSLEELQSKFAEALMDATENYQSAGNKATETNLSENVKFSMKSTVEETDKLIAVHNLTADKLISDIKLGGFPMPSIAIVKAKSGHSEFGDISVVFGKKTIDPKASVYNKVYGGDAWTPTYPAVEIETDYETAEKIYADARVVGNITFFNPVNLHPDNISDKINSAGGLDNFIKKYTADYGFKNFYLAETTGKPVSMQTKEETKVISEAEKEQYDYIINALGREAVLKSRAEGVSGRKWFEEFGEKYKAELKKYYLENVPNVTEEIAQSLVDSTPSFQHFKNVVSAAKYIQNGTAETKTVDDYEATHRAIDERINQAEYEQWLREKFNGIAKKSGIRNNVDAYTPMGGRRSFEALHYEETLENVVKVMRSQQNGETLFSGLGIWGVSAKEYRNISEIKADTQRLQSLSKEEYKAIKEGYGERLTEIAQGIKDKSEDNPFIALDNAMDCIVEAVRKSKTKSGIYNNLKKYQQLNVTEMAVDDIVSLIQDIANMPTEYFEAKPQRAVGFDEVEFVVLPQDTKSELVDMLNENGIEYRTYDTSNPDSRVEVLNSKPDIRWSVRDYSYNELISKPDMKVTLLDENVPNNRADIVSSAKKEAAKIGSFDAKTGTVSVYVDDIGNDVVISTKSIRHSLDRRMNVNGPVVLKIGDILKNSIKINELNPREENISESYVLIGTAKNTVDELYVVSFVVNSYTNTIDTVDVLYSANAKTEPAGSLSPRVSTPSTDSAISISDLLDYVNKYFPDILPEDVLKHFGHTQRPEGKLGESALFSDRDSSYMTAVESGDMETAQRLVDEAAREAGYSVRAMHSTNADFTVFDISKTSANNFHGKGIYFTSSLKDLENNYENYEGPDPWQKIEDRAYELLDEKHGLSYDDTLTGDAEIIDLLNECYDEAIAEFNDSQRRITAYLKFDNPFVFEKGDDINASVDRTVYDGIVDKQVYENIGHSGMDENTVHYIVFNPNNIKSSAPVTYDDNGNVIPLSKRFDSSKSDIRYSDRDYSFDPELIADLQTDADKLKSDVANLKELLKLQKTVTHGTVFTKTSVNAAASKLMKTFGMNQGKIELASALNEFYRFVASAEGLSWDSVMTEAGKVADRVIEIVPAREQRNDYSEKILKEIRNKGISLTDEQKTEIANKYDSYNNFRKSHMGSMILSDKGISLEKQWQEWAELYPDVFDKDVTAADMPEALSDIVSDLRLTRKMVKELDTAESRQMMLNEIYDSYWGVSTLHTLADRHQKQVNLLKSKHNSQMSELRAEYKEREKKTAQRYQEMIKRIREHKNRQMEEYKEAVRVSKERMSDQKKRTVMRNKIKKVVNELNQYLKGTKEKHVSEGMQTAVAEALSVINMDTVDADSRVAEYNARIEKATDPIVIEALTATRDRIQSQGDNLKSKLEDLQLGYAKIQQSSDPSLASAYNKGIEDKIASVVDVVGNTPLRNMSMNQLEEVYDLYKLVLTSIRDRNKMFVTAQKETVQELGIEAKTELSEVSKKIEYINSVNKLLRKIGYKDLKPIYFFRMLGSKTMTKLYKAVSNGQGTWYKDMREAKSFRIKTEKEYNYKNWDMKKTYSFTSNSGSSFKLTLQQIMSIYAYYRRDEEKAIRHLVDGGFVFDKSISVIKKEKGVPVKYYVNTAEAFNLSETIINNIISTLSDEQRAYVEKMQAYLSDTMGAKGNEVSLKLYDVKLFKEKNYFPIKSSSTYMDYNPEESGEVKIKNSGFTKATNQFANNPIVLSDFIDVWANHVNDMSMYHAFVLPLEDFTRVYNYRNITDRRGAIQATIETNYTEAANSYIKQLLKDINGGSVSGVGTEVIDKMVGLAKKGAVFASASVTVQQPSAIFRAMDQIDPKYFTNASTLNPMRHKQLWEECKQYAPIAGIKEMGYFDTGVGRTGIDWLKADEFDSFGEKFVASFKSKEQFKNSANDALSFFPSMADELTWVSIWEAVKKETRKTTNLEVGSEEFFKHCGERFTEVVDLTQVYDSVFARSELMRSKDRSVKMATAFMAEATVQANMIFDSALQLKRGKKSFARAIKTGLILTAAVIVNSLLKSPVGAGRDDDEDESYLEKLLGSFTGDVVSGLNPLTLIPFVKDIISIAQGYSVERMDMSVIDALVTSFFALGKETETPEEEQAKWANFAGATAQLFGVPLKNVYRDIKGIFNTYHTLKKDKEGRNTTKTGAWSAFLEGLSGTVTATTADKVFDKGIDVSKGKQYYDAIMSGDTAHANRIVASYDDKKKADNAIVDALEKFEPRITEAAQAHIDGSTTERVRISKEIIADGFAQDCVVKAVNRMISKLEKGEGESESSGKPKSLYTNEDYFNAAYDGNTSEANTYKEELIKFDMGTNDKTREEAESSFNSSFKKAVRKAVVKDGLTMEKATRMLADYGDVTEEKAYELAQGYDFVAQHPDLNYGWEADTVAKYLEKAEPAGISVSVYDDYLVKKSQCKGVDRNNDGKADKGTKKAQIYKMIDSLPITSQQKAVLKLMNK